MATVFEMADRTRSMSFLDDPRIIATLLPLSSVVVGGRWLRRER